MPSGQALCQGVPTVPPRQARSALPPPFLHAGECHLPATLWGLELQCTALATLPLQATPDSCPLASLRTAWPPWQPDPKPVGGVGGGGRGALLVQGEFGCCLRRKKSQTAEGKAKQQLDLANGRLHYPSSKGDQTLTNLSPSHSLLSSEGRAMGHDKGGGHTHGL